MAAATNGRGWSVRITGGECRGRIIAAPEGLEVRPTGSKERQAFFNILSNKIPGCHFVDVCAGSGLMGFEALSRGAAGLIAIEESKRLCQAIEENARRLGFGDVTEVINGDLRRVLPVLGEAEADIIFADPPYKSGLPEIILQLIDQHRLLSPDGTAVLEHKADIRLLEELDNMRQSDRRQYGQTAFSFFRRKG